MIYMACEQSKYYISLLLEVVGSKSNAWRWLGSASLPSKLGSPVDSHDMASKSSSMPTVKKTLIWLIQRSVAFTLPAIE